MKFLSKITKDDFSLTGWKFLMALFLLYAGFKFGTWFKYTILSYF